MKLISDHQKGNCFELLSNSLNYFFKDSNVHVWKSVWRFVLCAKG